MRFFNRSPVVTSLMLYPPLGKGTDRIGKEARNERSKQFEITMKQRYDARDIWDWKKDNIYIDRRNH